MNLKVAEYQVVGKKLQAVVSYCDDADEPLFSEMVILNRKDSKARFEKKLKSKFPDETSGKNIVELLTDLGTQIKDSMSDKGGNGSHPESPFFGDIPEIPEDAWAGLFKDYRMMVGETTEASDSFHYAIFCQVLGITLGRKVHVYHSTPLYPNFYIALVGRSGLARKDSATSRGMKLLNRLHYQENDGANTPEVRVVSGIRSYEGLLDELNGNNKIRLIRVAELLSLLSKSKQDASSNIVPQLTELYDCPDWVNPPIKGSNIQAKRPFVSILAGTTQSWLNASLTLSHVYGGFANRWMYFTGASKGPKPSPPKVDPAAEDWLIKEINDIREWTKTINNGGEIRPDDTAVKCFHSYYNDYYTRCSVDGLFSTLIVRVQDFVWKLSLLYAIMERSTVIKGEHLERAILVGNYLEASVLNVFHNFATTKSKQEEEKFIQYMQSVDRPVSKRELYRAMSISAKELDNIMEHLVKIGIVRMENIRQANNKMMVTYELII